MHNGHHEEQEFPIRKGVPLPHSSGNTTKQERYPWREMDVGDSFVVPFRGGDVAKQQASVATVAKHASKRHGHKYTTRRLEGGIGVWRVE